VPPVELGPGAVGEQKGPPHIEATLGAELKSGLEVAIGGGVAPAARRPPGQRDEGSACMLVQTRLLGELDAPLELLRTALPRELLDDPDVRQRVDEDLGIVEVLGHAERAPTPVGRRLCIVQVHVEVREIAVRHGELVPRRELLEHRHARLPDAHRLLCPADVPEQS
jgi:hypothetical protein